MLSSILNEDTKEEFKKIVDVAIFPIKVYSILLLIFFLVIIFQLYLLIKLKDN